MTCLREGTVQLADGRRLGFGEYGVRDGIPVLLFHGLPGGRGLDLRRQELVEAGAWLFSLERPGIGLSDRQPGRTLLDWPVDVAVFADHMGLERFAVIGMSAGAPYALACGNALVDRVLAVGVVCGFLPKADEPPLVELLDDRFRDDLIAYRSDPQRVLADRLERVSGRCRDWARDPEWFFDELFGPAANVLPRGYWMRILAATYGGEPHTDEDVVLYCPWGFSFEDVAVPIHAWHGDADDAAPLALVEELVRRAPEASLTVYPGEGHFLGPTHHSEYLLALTTSGSPRR